MSYYIVYDTPIHYFVPSSYVFINQLVFKSSFTGCNSIFQKENNAVLLNVYGHLRKIKESKIIKFNQHHCVTNTKEQCYKMYNIN